VIILAPFLAVAAAAGKPVLVSSPASLALLAYLGVATMALSYGLLYAGMRTTSGSAAPSPRSSSRCQPPSSRPCSWTSA
jgi:DME family drug/metabolite transporter